MRKVLLFSLFFSAAVLTAGGMGAAAQKSDAILGRWDLVVEGANGPYTSWLEVSRDASGKLGGRFVGQFGSARPIRQIEFSDGALKFSLPPQYEPRKDELVFTGRLEGGKLSGKTTSESGKTLNWSGVRAPELKAGKIAWGKPVQLFNGKDLSGWKLRDEKARGCWSIEDGAMTNSKGCVDIITEQKFKDFKLSLELKLALPKENGGQPSNSGIYLRGRHEVQVLDDYGKPAESHGMGSVYGFITPKTNAAKPAGEWQKYEITFVGRWLRVVLNGQTIIDNQEIPGITGGALDSAEGLPGPIMLQGDHGKVWYRNIVLTPAK